MSTQINGNNIQATTRGLVEAWSITEQLNLPPLNQSAINALGTPAFGTLVYNTTEDMAQIYNCLLYTSPSPRDATLSRMPSSA